MKRRLAVALLASAPAALFVWGGCALVIDLGDEARLRPADASTETADVIEDAGPTDASADVSTSPATCGLPPSPNATCNGCIETSCCDVSKACGADPDCAARLECIKDCMADSQCIILCLIGNVNISALTNCSANNCGPCSPGPECIKLGACARTFGDAGQEALLRTVARGVVLEVDEAKCKAQRGSLAEVKDAEPACIGQ